MRRPTTAVLIALAGLLPAVRTRAELVVLDGGEVVKVASFDADGESARLTFKEGGVMTLPMLRIDRVLEDEVEEPVAAGAGLSDVAAPAAFPVAFDAAQTVPTSPYGGMIYAAAKENALNPLLVAAV